MIIPTHETALEFALLLSTGVPSHEAIRYFAPDDTPPPELARQHEHWVGSHAVRQAIVKLQGKAWQEMEPMERLKIAVEKHYAELAYFLYSHNYSDLMGAEKTKADTCREAIERKISGTAGKDDAFSRYLTDVMSGKVKLQTARPS